MNCKELIEKQWNGYSKFHQSRTNLLIHIVCVPVFILGFIKFVGALITLQLSSVLVSLIIMAVAFGLQGFGHNQEVQAAEPFAGIKNAITRILLEQLYTFPKFVLTGAWYKAFSKSKP